MLLEIFLILITLVICFVLMTFALYSLDEIVSFVREEIWGEQPYEDRVKSWLKKK